MEEPENSEKHTVEYALHINVEDIIPSLLFWEVEEWSAPRNAGVVHQYVEFVLAFAELGDERVAACF